MIISARDVIENSRESGKQKGTLKDALMVILRPVLCLTQVNLVAKFAAKILSQNVSSTIIFIKNMTEYFMSLNMVKRWKILSVPVN